MTVYIPFAIQEEIMKRLPTKSLMRFRSVSKPYKSLIDSSKFISEYSFNHTHQEHLLVSYLAVTHDYKYVSFVDDDTFPQEKLSIPIPVPGLIHPATLGSSQGLFCLYSLCGDVSDTGKIVNKFVLWNPSIRKSVVIVVPFLDQLDGHNIFGFGVCPRTKDPKLVNISYIQQRLFNPDIVVFTPWQVEVYTLSSGSWRSIPTITQPRNSIELLSDGQVVTDEFIYWLAIDCVSTNMTTPDFKGCNMIVSFNLKSENFMEVSLPDTLADAHNRNLTICKLQNSLVVVEVVKEAAKQVYGIWMMNSNIFTKLFNINLQDALIDGVLGFRKNNVPIFDMTTNDDVYAFFFQERYPEHTSDLSVQDCQAEHINYFGISGKGLSFAARSYMETLLLSDR